MNMKSIAEKSNPARSTIEDSLHGLATIIALMAALLSSGQIWEAVYPLMYDYLWDAYDFDEIAMLGAGAFSLLSIAVVFFICRIVFVLGLMVLAQNVLFRFAF